MKGLVKVHSSQDMESNESIGKVTEEKYSCNSKSF